jgi:hypothetical protein
MQVSLPDPGIPCNHRTGLDKGTFSIQLRNSVFFISHVSALLNERSSRYRSLSSYACVAMLARRLWYSWRWCKPSAFSKRSSAFLLNSYSACICSSRTSFLSSCVCLCTWPTTILILSLCLGQRDSKTSLSPAKRWISYKHGQNLVKTHEED